MAIPEDVSQPPLDGQELRAPTEGPAAGPGPFVDIIWNLTKICVWDCGVCCVDADHVRRRGKTIEIRTHGLTKVETLPFDPSGPGIFSQALAHQQRRGLELGLDAKRLVIDHLKGFRPRLDFSGGDALAVDETFEVLQYANEKFGRDAITLTVTGAGSKRYSAAQLAPLIGEFNFTFDGPPEPGGETRPQSYALGNLRKAREMVDAGVPTRGELPLTRENVAPETLRRIYLALADAGIDRILVMRLFAVGRGHNVRHQTPTPSDYSRAIATLRDLEAEHGGPEVKLQCALRRLDPARDSAGPNPCDALRESFGLTADGTLLISPWAVNPQGAPMHQSWVLGNLATTPLGELLDTDRVRRLRARLDENRGACKIFAWQNSPRGPNDEGRFFDETDPLYG